MDYNDNNKKTWDLAQRARKVSKGQAKIFLTRNAGDEQRLAKLTQNLEKEKSAKHSELNFAQKLLVKRYGAGKTDSDVTMEPGRSSRNRSITWDSTFMTKPDVSDNDGRTRAVTFDVQRKNSTAPSRGIAERPRDYSRDKELGPVRRFSHTSHFQPRTRYSPSGCYSEEDINRLLGPQEPRPRALSEILPPIMLPPIYKADQSLPTGEGLKSRFTTGHLRNTTAPETGRTRKRSLMSTMTQLNSSVTSVDEGTSAQFDDSLEYCRYLRRGKDEDY